jgi:hypothetical protein
MKPNVKRAYFSVPQCVEMYSGTYLFITAGILDIFHQRKMICLQCGD